MPPKANLEQHPELTDQPKTQPDAPVRIDEHVIPPEQVERLRKIDAEFRKDAEQAGEPKTEQIGEPAAVEGQGETNAEPRPDELAKQHEHREQNLSQVDKSGRLGPQYEPAISTDERIDPATGAKLKERERVYLEGSRPGPESYQGRVNDRVRKENLGFFSENDKPQPDDGRGAEAAGAAYAARVRQYEPAAKNEAAAAPDAEVVEESAPSDDKAAAAEPEQVPKTAEEPASPEASSDQPPSAPEPSADRPTPEPTSETVPKATTEPDLPSIKRVICDLTDTGVQGRQVLEYMRREHPDLFGHKDFRLVVGTSTDERGQLIRDSSAFQEFIEAGKAEIKTITADDNLPEGTLLTLAPDPNAETAIKMLKQQDGHVIAALDTVSLKGDDAVVVVDTDKPGVAGVVDPRFFGNFETTHSPMAMSLARNLSGRLGSKLNVGDMRDTPLARKERVVESVMDAASAYVVVNYQPELRATTARLAEQSELVHMVGFMAEINNRPPITELAHRQGLVIDTMSELSTIRQGAADADTAVFVPEAPAGDMHYVLIDSSDDKAARGAVQAEYSSVVTAPNEDTLNLLQNARKHVDAELKAREAGAAPDVSASELITSEYTRLVERSPRAAYDHDLNLSLAQLFASGGDQERALEFAQKAVDAAPQLAASAHTLKGNILLEQGDLTTAQAELVRANQIAPNDARVYEGLASYARNIGDDEGLLHFLIEQQRNSSAPTLADKFKMVRNWEEMIQTTVRIGQNADPNEPGTTYVEETTTYNQDAKRYVTTYGEPYTTTLQEDLLAEAAAMREAALASIKRLFDTERGEDQDQSMGVIDASIDASVLSGIRAPENLRLTLEEAQIAQRLHELRNQVLGAEVGRYAVLKEVIERGNVGDHQSSIVLGHFINPDGSRAEPGGTSDLVLVKRQHLNSSAEIYGLPNYGKTTTETRMAIELVKSGLPVMIIDAGIRSQYLEFIGALEKQGIPVNYISTHPDAAMSSLGFLRPEEDYSMDRFVQDLQSMWFMLANAREPFSQFTAKGTAAYFAELGYDISINDGPNPNKLDIPRQANLRAYTAMINHMADVAGYSTVQGDVSAFTGVRTGQAKEEPIGSFIDSSEQVLDMQRLLREASVVDLTRLQGPQKAFAMAAMILKLEQALVIRRERMGDADLPLNFLLVIGEAAIVLGEPTIHSVENAAEIERAELFGNVFTQLRGTGFGGVASSQNPTLIRNVSDNTVVKIAHRIVDPEHQAKIIASMKGREDDKHLLGNLDPGQALIYTPDMDRKGPQLMRVDDIERNPVRLSEPRLANPPYIDNGGRRVKMTREVRLAQSEAVQSRNADMRVWVTALTLAHMGNTPLPGALPGMKEKWGVMDQVQREALLEAVIETVVDDRSTLLPYDVDHLKTRVKDVAANHLGRINEQGEVESVDITGKLPGTSLTVPQVVWALAYERDAWPYQARQPNPYGPAEKVEGLPSKKEIPSGRVKDQIKALEENEHAALARYPKNQRAFSFSVMGESNGALWSWIDDLFKGDEGDRELQVRRLEEQMGLVKPGDPKPGPLARLLSVPLRLIFDDAV
jgi:tetratricopeptide (TPR) repeat protein